MIAAVCVRWLAMVTTASKTARTAAMTPTFRPNGSAPCSCSWWISSSAIVDFRIIEVRMTTDEEFMRQALALAAQSADEGEGPVGAVVVMSGAVVGRSE